MAAQYRSYASKGSFRGITVADKATAKRSRDKEMVRELEKQDARASEIDQTLLNALRRKYDKEATARGKVEQATREGKQLEMEQRKKNAELKAEFAEMEARAAGERLEALGELLPSLGQSFVQIKEKKDAYDAEQAQLAVDKAGLTSSDVIEMKKKLVTSEEYLYGQQPYLIKLRNANISHEQYNQIMSGKGLYGNAGSSKIIEASSTLGWQAFINSKAGEATTAEGTVYTYHELVTGNVDRAHLSMVAPLMIGIQEKFLYMRGERNLGDYNEAFKRENDAYNELISSHKTDIARALRKVEAEHVDIANENDFVAFKSDVLGRKRWQDAYNGHYDAGIADRNDGGESGDIYLRHSIEMMKMGIGTGRISIDEAEEWLANIRVYKRGSEKPGTLREYFPGRAMEIENAISDFYSARNKNMNARNNNNRLEVDSDVNKIYAAFAENQDINMLKEGMNRLPNTIHGRKRKAEMQKIIDAQIKEVSEVTILRLQQLKNSGNLTPDLVDESLPMHHPQHGEFMTAAKTQVKAGLTTRKQNDTYNRMKKGIKKILAGHGEQGIMPDTGESVNPTFDFAVQRAEDDFDARVINYQLNGDTLEDASYKARKDLEEDLKDPNGIYKLGDEVQGAEYGYQRFDNLDALAPVQEEQLNIDRVKKLGPSAVDSVPLMTKEMAAKLAHKLKNGQTISYGERHYIDKLADALPGVDYMDIVHKQDILLNGGEGLGDLPAEIQQVKAANVTENAYSQWINAGKLGERRINSGSTNGTGISPLNPHYEYRNPVNIRPEVFQHVPSGPGEAGRIGTTGWATGHYDYKGHDIVMQTKELASLARGLFDAYPGLSGEVTRSQQTAAYNAGVPGASPTSNHRADIGSGAIDLAGPKADAIGANPTGEAANWIWEWHDHHWHIEPKKVRGN